MKFQNYLALGAVIVTSLLAYAFISKRVEKMKADKEKAATK